MAYQSNIYLFRVQRVSRAFKNIFFHSLENLEPSFVTEKNQ